MEACDFVANGRPEVDSRFDPDTYKKYGYVPFENISSAAAVTLSYATDDWYNFLFLMKLIFINTGLLEILLRFWDLRMSLRIIITGLNFIETFGLKKINFSVQEN
jgi:hypothetical protein